MSLAQIYAFHHRLRRVAEIHGRGGRFEAPGTLGKQRRVEESRFRGLRAAAFLIFSVIAAKVALILWVGPADYADRITLLAASERWANELVAWLMQADALTWWLVRLIV